MTTPTRSHRLEARLDAEADALISEAARFLGISRSAFVVDAARNSAQRVLARADLTLMSESQFDVLFESLDERTPLPRLARVATADRDFLRT